MLSPRLRFRLRLAEIALGIVLIVWLTFEDQNITPVQLLALASAAVLAVRFVDAVRSSRMLALTGTGLVAGFAASPIAAGLMLVKIGLHSHGQTPDFTIEDIAQVFSRAPLFGLAGLLIGAGLKAFFFSK